MRGAAGQSTDAASRELLLTPGALDEFFALYEGHSVLFREGDAALLDTPEGARPQIVC